MLTAKTAITIIDLSLGSVRLSVKTGAAGVGLTDFRRSDFIV